MIEREGRRQSLLHKAELKIDVAVMPDPGVSVSLAIDYAKTDVGKKFLRIAGEIYGKQAVDSLPPQAPE